MSTDTATTTRRSPWGRVVYIARRAWTMEIGIWQSLYRFIFRRPRVPAGAVGFSYHRQVWTILMIFIGSLAAVLRDRQTHSGTLFGVFFTALITTIAAVQVVIRPLIEDVASQAIVGLFLAYNAQMWAGKATKAAIKKFTDKAGSETND